METIKSPRLAAQRRRLTLLLAVSLALASGCAQVPRLDPPPAMKKVERARQLELVRGPLDGLAGQ